MKLISFLNLSHLPYVETETRLIDGREQLCLILPTGSNQIKRARNGNFIIVFYLNEQPLNPKCATHEMALSYNDKSEAVKYPKRRNRSYRMGPVYPCLVPGDKKISRTNNAAPLKYYGRLILSDIPKDLIYKQKNDRNLYLSNLTFKGVGGGRTVYTGSICISDIPRKCIKIDNETGKKYLDTIFQKLPQLDIHMNTHQLVVRTQNGSEVEIGRFKEWVMEGTNPQSAPTQQNTQPNNQKPTPESIDGIKF